MAEIKMKPFNLERALAGDPVVYRNGTQVKEIFAFKSNGCTYPVVTLTGYGFVTHHTREGHASGSNSLNADPRDLFMAALTEVVWVNIYREPTDPCGFQTGAAYATKQLAEANAGTSVPSKAYPVEVEY